VTPDRGFYVGVTNGVLLSVLLFWAPLWWVLR
jgi:hypothetical protein